MRSLRRTAGFAFLVAVQGAAIGSQLEPQAEVAVDEAEIEALDALWDADKEEELWNEDDEDEDEGAVRALKAGRRALKAGGDPCAGLDPQQEPCCTLLGKDEQAKCLDNAVKPPAPP